MKRIIVCMDGTWQTLSQERLTNIGIIARSIAHKQTVDQPDGSKREIQQIVIYTQGVGSTVGALSKNSISESIVAWASRTFGGALGVGLEDGIVDTYLRVAFNYEEGDEIYIFGFSRGAYAARRLAGFINAAGIVSRRHVDKAREGFRLYNDGPREGASEEAKAEQERAEVQFRTLYGKGGRHADGTRYAITAPPPITYLGVFDTVVQRGLRAIIAGAFRSRRYKFRNLRVCPNVLSARHALALDESRLGFPSTPWNALDEANAAAHARPGADPSRTYYDQRWFIGTHGDVGGGNESRLSALALKWVAEGAAAQGLRFYQTHGEDTSPLDDALKDADLCFDNPITRPALARSLELMNLPLSSRHIWSGRVRPTMEDAQRVLHPSVLSRVTSDHIRPRYRPDALRPLQKALRDYEKQARQKT